MSGFEVLAVERRDRLGEGPWWDAASSRLWWIDIDGHRIRHAGLDGTEGAPIDTPTEVGFTAPDEAGGLIAGLRDGLWRRSADGEWHRLWQADYDASTHRINDGKTDPAGRVWFGTMMDAETGPSAAFYCFDGTTTRRVFGGVTTSNGLGWSPDRRVFYYTDTPTRTIWAFDFEPEAGTLDNRRIFVRDPEGRFPDGLTVDAEGCVWSAKWQGSAVVRYTPDGRIDKEVRLPVRKPTCPTFAGDDLSVLAVTSANQGPEDGELAGSVFLVQTSTTGQPPTPARAATGPNPARDGEK